jgi:uncharacterized membrane protein YadS
VLTIAQAAPPPGGFPSGFGSFVLNIIVFFQGTMNPYISAAVRWFALAFTSIGLETKFSDLFNNEGKKPLYAFLIAQLFNIIISLVIAHFLFK